MSPLEAPSGSDLIITVTSDAVDKLKELRAEEADADQLGLRLEVVSDAGEEFRYDLSFCEYLDAAFTDEVRTHDGLKVVIPGRDIDRLQGATLDYGDATGLVIRNPNRPDPPRVEGLTGDDDLSAEIEAMVSNEVNPALAAHGGFVTYVGHDGARHRLSHHGWWMPRLLDEQDDDARGRADDVVRRHRRRHGGEGPHRPFHR